MPPEEDPNTGEKVKRHVLAEHRHLDTIFAEVRAAFDKPEAAARALAQLIEALDVHFQQEDDLYYPAVASHRPDLAPRLKAISAGHGVFRDDVERVRSLLERGEIDAARRSFESLARAFEQHETVEEQILAELDRGIAAAR